MGRALQVITGRAVNPGATLTAVTPNTGDSLAVQSANFGDPISLVQAWAFTTTNLFARIRSPRMHDQAQNMRLQPTASKAYPLLPWSGAEPLYPQDNMIVELAGGAAETDLISLLIYYSNLPGTAARLHYPSEVEPLIQHLTTVEVDLTASATAGQYGNSVALNANFDTLERNRTYAILGYEAAVDGGTVGIRGADTGNLRLGGPLINIPFLTSNWFVRLSNEYGLPCIPVVNAANVAAIQLDCAAGAAGATFAVGLHLALLSDPNPL